MLYRFLLTLFVSTLFLGCCKSRNDDYQFDFVNNYSKTVKIRLDAGQFGQNIGGCAEITAAYTVEFDLSAGESRSEQFKGTSKTSLYSIIDGIERIHLFENAESEYYKFEVSDKGDPNLTKRR